MKNQYRVIGIAWPDLDKQVTVGDFDTRDAAEQKAAECSGHKNFIAHVVDLMDPKALAKRAVIMDKTVEQFISELPAAALAQPQEYVNAFDQMIRYRDEICADTGATFD